jgi:uncharacterized protein YggU (UPF0235/DUF167 family)
MAATTRLAVRVAPSASSEQVVGRYGAAWKVRVGAAPERGRANEAVVRLIAGAAGLGQREVRVVSGHGARDKILELTGITPDELERRLLAAGKDSA